MTSVPRTEVNSGCPCKYHQGKKHYQHKAGNGTQEKRLNLARAGRLAHLIDHPGGGELRAWVRLDEVISRGAAGQTGTAHTQPFHAPLLHELPEGHLITDRVTFQDYPDLFPVTGWK